MSERILAGVRVASERQRHRGPDADGFFATDGPRAGVAFAHRRLAIIDLSEGGAQPKRDPDTGAVIVFNGEIYNYRELRSELRSLGVQFRTESDTEVLLLAYRQWGDACISRLVGMFTFAIWDPRTRRVLLARDRLGIKPLYLARVHGPDGDTLLFASELRALLATGMVPRQIDETALQTYLWHGFVAGPDSLIRGVTRLEPGAALEVRVDDLSSRSWKYWELPAHAPRAGALEELRGMLADAVRCRLIADVPVGVFLSGGIDSSVVAALAARSAEGQLKTFNVGFDERSLDESPYAAAVAKHVGAGHTEVRLTGDAFAAQLDAALGSLDQPSFDAINTYFVSRAVREAGITVALAGTGGDELFGGYRSFIDLPRVAAASRLARVLPSAALGAASDALSRAIARSSGTSSQSRWGKLSDALQARGDLAAVYQIGCALFTPRFLATLAPSLDWRKTALGLGESQAAKAAAAVHGAPPLHGVATLELASFVSERLLPDTDTASMAVALEVRVPLLDHRVVELCAALPIERRFQPLGRKALLRELGLEGFPPGLFDRPKQGFELPMSSWLVGKQPSAAGTALRGRVAETLASRDLLARVGLDPATTESLWRAYASGSSGLYWSRPWSLFALLDWCRREGASL